MRSDRIFRYVTLSVLGLYVIIPMYATVQFSLEGGYHGQLSFDAYTQGCQPARARIEHHHLARGLSRGDGAHLGAARADDPLRPPAPAALRPCSRRSRCCRSVFRRS
jgi:hypothetical protein